jgi:DNA-binding GntR family transcriptional regulator
MPEEQNLTVKVDAIQTTSEVIAESLKEMIYEGKLLPRQQLKQDEVARMFGVSRVPVRDALNRLIRMGLAIGLPRRGVIVNPLSRRLVEELFAVRKILEVEAAALALTHFTPRNLAQLQDLIDAQIEARERDDIKYFEELDEQFHIALYGATRNRTLQDLIFSIWHRVKQARWSAVIVREHAQRWMGNSIQRHRSIVDALRSKDEDRVRSIISEIIDGSLQEVIVNLEETGWLDADNHES